MLGGFVLNLLRRGFAKQKKEDSTSDALGDASTTEAFQLDVEWGKWHRRGVVFSSIHTDVHGFALFLSRWQSFLSHWGSFAERT